MKKATLLLFLLFGLIVLQNAKAIFIDGSAENVCPSQQYIYFVMATNTQIQGTFDWRVSNGTIVGLSKGEGLSSIKVIWSDVRNKGTITLLISPPASNPSLFGATNLARNFNIFSLNGVAPRLVSPSASIPFGVEKYEEFSIVGQIYYYNSSESPTYYEWTLPDGWVTTSGLKGTFTIQNSKINVKVDPFKRGDVKVRAKSLCGLYSDYATKSFETIKGIKKYPSEIRLGSRDSYTFEFNPINQSGVLYEWDTPAGWSINGGTNTLTTSLSSVQIKPSCEVNGSVRVRLQLNGKTSDWYNFPFKVIRPEINLSQGHAVYQSEIYNISLGPIDNFTSINWINNNFMTILEGQGTPNIKAAFKSNVLGTDTLFVEFKMKDCPNRFISNFYFYIRQARMPVLQFSEYPTGVSFGNEDELRFCVKPVNETTESLQYEWVVPDGWSINGGGSTLNTTDACMKVKPNSNVVDLWAGVFVRVYSPSLNSWSKWYKFPFGVRFPEIKCDKLKEPSPNMHFIYPHNIYHFYLDTPVNFNEFIWTCENLNMTIVEGQGTPSIKAYFNDDVYANGTLSVTYKMENSSAILKADFPIQNEGYPNLEPIFTLYPDSIPFGSTDEYIFELTPKFETADLALTYEWTVHDDWKINDGTNNLLTEHNRVKIKPGFSWDYSYIVKTKIHIKDHPANGYPADYSREYTFPTRVTIPKIKINKPDWDLYQHEVYRITLDHPIEFSKIEWINSGNMVILGGQGTNSIDVFFTAKSCKVDVWYSFPHAKEREFIRSVNYNIKDRNEPLSRSAPNAIIATPIDSDTEIQVGDSIEVVYLRKFGEEDVKTLEETHLNESAFLGQNKPNPFGNQTSIPFFIPENTKSACLFVYDTQGRLIKKIIIHDTGKGEIVLEGGDFKDGPYIYSLFIDQMRIDSKYFIKSNR